MFIDDNTNGTPGESGELWQFGLDFVMPVKRFGGHPLDDADAALNRPEWEPRLHAIALFAPLLERLLH